MGADIALLQLDHAREIPVPGRICLRDPMLADMHEADVAGRDMYPIRTPPSVGTISQTVPLEPAAAGSRRSVPVCCSQPKADIVIYFDVTRAYLAGVTTSMFHARGDVASSRLQATALPAPFLINSRGRWHAAITAARRCVMWPLPA